MYPFKKLVVLFFSAALVVSQDPTAPNDCKCTPSDSCWPSESDFKALNDSVAGYLIKGVPPGSVCYTDQPNYNESQCQYVRENWLVSTFHALDPVSIGWPQWAGNPCPPIYPNGDSVNGDTGAGARGCQLGGYPAYALNATSADHVQRVVRFAKDHNIRLNVKSTGHSFTGRSTAYGSISVWTHYLQGIEYRADFIPERCNVSSTQIAFQIGAGSRVRDVYEAADQHDALVVGGSAEDVGIVGWFTGGGHGPLSSTYGMGVDNVLQVTIVTPDGDLITANECQHPDLFWAIRGGGGGTFGVITEVVMKGYPSATAEKVDLAIEASNSQDLTSFWNAVIDFWSDQPRLKAGGLSGYAYLLPDRFSPTGKWSISGLYFTFGQPNGTATKLLEPIAQRLSNYSATVNYTATSTFYPTFLAMWNSYVSAETVGGINAILGSRLLPSHALTTDPSHLKSTLQNLTNPNILAQLQFHLVANSANRNLNVSLNPAWRDAVLHTIFATGFLDSATLPEQQAVYDEVTYEVVPQLKSLAPNSGSYFNEADPNDPNWQYSFFGTNYPQLRAVKQKYDPDGVLWCRSCVGSEDWIPQYKYDTVIGEGKLCRAKWNTAAAQKVL